MVVVVVGPCAWIVGMRGVEEGPWDKIVDKKEKRGWRVHDRWSVGFECEARERGEGER